jgi:CheY-like chemotaxis protein
MLQPNLPPTAISGQTILIVDDVSSVRYYHAYIIQKAGFRCEVASDGQEALKKLEHGQIDLVVLDIVMPNLGGLELINKIRSTPALAKLPLLVISSEPIGDQVRKASTAEAGPVGYAQKPLAPAVIFQEMNRLLKGAA